MIGRIYSIIFILFIICAFVYQHISINQSTQELSNKNENKSLRLIASWGSDFQTLYYKKGQLKSSFTGKKITYYNDGTFDATGDLVYEEFNENKKSVVIIKTENGFGQFEGTEDKKNSFFSENKKLKFVILPGDVTFNFLDNIGKTKNVYIDPVRRLVSSSEKAESKGPLGNLKGQGFKYDLNKEELHIESRVQGTYNPGNNQ